MDRIHRREIGACSFLRPAQFFIRHNWNSDSVRFGDGERWQRREFDDGDFHRTGNGNLFLLIYGTGGISSFIIYCSVRGFS